MGCIINCFKKHKDDDDETNVTGPEERTVCLRGARMTFVLRNPHFGVCLDILESVVASGRPVGVYRFVHGGSNQLWSWNKSKLVSALDASYCLGVDTVGVVVLARPSEPRTDWLRTDDGLIVCSHAKDMAITCNGGCAEDRVVVKKRGGEASQIWVEEHWDNSPRPACSCHLTYLGLTASDVSAPKWTLQCSVRVRDTADSTYFCVVGWAPGGYSGIQQIEARTRVAIFSMWDDGSAEGSVSMVRAANDVKVTAFGNEGTGLKSMKEVQWREGELMTFIVEGVLEATASPGALQTWTCSCWYTLRDEKHFMAAFRRRSCQQPLRVNGFYSFVEDWDRSPKACGHASRRCAEFLSPKIGTRPLTEATFSKVTTGCDAHYAHRAFGCVKEAGFVLSTGGEVAEEHTKSGTTLVLK